MKRILCICLALMLFFTAACSRKTDTDSLKPSSPGTEASDTAQPAAQEPAAPNTEPTVESQPAPIAKAVEDYVSVLESRQIIYEDSLNNHYDISIVIPVLTLDSPDAQSANNAIQSACLPRLDEVDEAKECGYSAFLESISYDAWLNDNLLTVLVNIEYITDDRDYMLYVFDLATGKQITNDDMAALLHLDRNALDAQISATVERKFLSMFESMLDQDFTRQQLDSTCSAENIAAAQVYLNEAGAPWILCTIYSIAGAESYEYLLPLE